MNNNLPINFFAPVQKVSTQEVAPGFNTCSYNSHAIVMEVQEGKKIVNFCSEGYALIPTSAIFPQLEQLIEGTFPIEKSYRMTQDGKFYVDYVFNNSDSEITAGDSIKKMIQIQHSYNSKLLFKVIFGDYRQICSNGLFGWSLTQGVELSHVTGNLSNIIENTFDSVRVFIEEASDSIIQYKQLASRSLTNHYKERITEIIEKTGFYKSYEKEVVERVELEAARLPITDWLIYNAFNYQLNHNRKITAQTENKVKLDKKVFQFIHQHENQLLS